MVDSSLAGRRCASVSAAVLAAVVSGGRCSLPLDRAGSTGVRILPPSDDSCTLRLTVRSSTVSRIMTPAVIKCVRIVPAF